MLVEPHAIVVVAFDTPLTGRQVTGVVERAVHLPEDDWAPRQLYVTKVYRNNNMVFLTQMSGYPDAQVAISKSLDEQYVVLDQLYESISVYDVSWPVKSATSLESDYIAQIILGVERFAEKIRLAYSEAVSSGTYPESSDC